MRRKNNSNGIQLVVQNHHLNSSNLIPYCLITCFPYCTPCPSSLYLIFSILHSSFLIVLSTLYFRKKEERRKKKKKNKQTPIRDIYLNSISSPLEKVKETPIDIVLNKIFMTGQRCIQSITAPLAPIPQLFSLSVEYINYQRMPFLSVFFFYFKTILTQSRKLLQPPPTQLWLPSL